MCLTLFFCLLFIVLNWYYNNINTFLKYASTLDETKGPVEAPGGVRKGRVTFCYFLYLLPLFAHYLHNLAVTCSCFLYKTIQSTIQSKHLGTKPNKTPSLVHAPFSFFFILILIMTEFPCYSLILQLSWPHVF